ncbi:MAG: lysylphosphatidylglycerol synthase transmembrane domain-containing protein [Candidatus Cloacimonetes bacterium]|nr:lysylphosphatidylglycerol synthase transmembrane domain-containing protein [Candidatus Cloacimonadota bacterium]
MRKRSLKPLGKVLTYFMKVGFSVFILYVVLSRMDLPLLAASIRQLPLWLPFALLGLSCVRHFIQLNNWRCSLHLNPLYRDNWRELISSYLVAQPLRFLIPGGHASLAKVYYLQNSSRLASLVSTLVERLFMTWATWSFAAIAAFSYFPSLSLPLRLFLMLFTSFMPVIALLVLTLVPKWQDYVDFYVAEAPKMMLLQIGNTLIMYLQYYLVLNHLGVISLVDTYIGMALTNISNSIPITISGLGLREGFAVIFLNGFGFGAEQAVAATLTVFLFQDCVPALVGLYFLITGKRLEIPEV